MEPISELPYGLKRFAPERVLSWYSEVLGIFDNIHWTSDKDWEWKTPGRFMPPRYLIFYPSYVCNQNCIYCYYRNLITDSEEGFVPTDRAIGLIDELYKIGCRFIDYCGGGEPLIHPDIKKIISVSRELGYNQGTLTNGTFEESLCYTIARSFSFIRFSIDSFSAKTYRTIRRPRLGSSLEKSLQNCIDICSLRDRYKKPIEVGIHFNVTSQNYLELEQLFQFAERTHLNFISYSIPAPVLESESNSRNRLFSLDKLQLIEFAKLSEKLKGQYDSKFRILTKPYTESKAPCKCFSNVMHTLIDAYGDVYLCSYYFYRQNSHRIGNAFQEKFSDIWGSSLHQKAMQAVDLNHCSTFRCRWHTYNYLFKKIMTNQSLLEQNVC